MIKFHSAEKSVNEWGSESLLYSVLKYGAFVRPADEGKVLKRMVSKSMEIEKKIKRREKLRLHTQIFATEKSAKTNKSKNR